MEEPKFPLSYLVESQEVKIAVFGKANVGKSATLANLCGLGMYSLYTTVVVVAVVAVVVVVVVIHSDQLLLLLLLFISILFGWFVEIRYT